MPRYCANLSKLFVENPILERPFEAKSAGFKAVEILFPYDTNASDLGHALARSGLPLALINCPPPNYADGPRGFAAIPELEGRFQYDFKRALRYARALGVKHLHVMSGVAQGQEAKETLIRNLQWATALAPAQSLTIEPVNNVDMPGYFMNDFDLARDVIQAVDAPNLGLQFDAYHAHVLTKDVLGTWDQVKDIAVHVQVAGYPGRHEPICRKIDYPAFFAQLDADGYTGWVSGEYSPVTTTTDGLAWMKSC